VAAFTRAGRTWRAPQAAGSPGRQAQMPHNQIPAQVTAGVDEASLDRVAAQLRSWAGFGSRPQPDTAFP
jgi:hypothetical protein